MVSLELVCQVINYGMMICYKIQIHTIFIIKIIKCIFISEAPIKGSKNKTNHQIKVNLKVQYYN